MAVYSSGNVMLQAPAETVYNKLSNLENLRGMLDKVPADRIPEDKRQMFENIVITPDTIEVPGGPMGSLTFRVTERKSPSLIKLKGEGIPMQMSLSLHVAPKTETSSEAKVDLDIDIPMMLRPLIGGQIQKIADQFGDVLGAIPFS
ncbi:MAG: SRPBCC family protein [Muribaculaceae bacterium]|nr:SRPBCC family protein [Muribaculaceae bacterium]